MVSCQSTEHNAEGVYDYSGLLNKRDLHICKAIAKEYAPEARIYILPDQPLSYGILGLANQVGPNTYIIQTHRLNDRPLETLFHEMGHIIDSETGRLEFTGDMGWDGERCDFTIPWMERPWEISANEWRDCLRHEYLTGTLNHYNYLVWELLPKHLYSHNTYCEE